jgi:aryl carrier-like protein
VASGYLKNAEGTAKAFITPPPWVDLQSKAWKAYRTGDLVRYNADSSIRIIGRADRQLKLRGKRVELAEIDNAIRRTGCIDQVVTDVFKRNEIPLLVSFITAAFSDMPHIPAKTTTIVRDSPNQSETIQRIRHALQQDLPIYMQPWAIIVVNNIPRSSSGKVDRRMLQRIAKTWSLEDEEAKPVAPKAPSAGAMSRTELTVQEFWSDILGIDRQRIRSDGMCIPSSIYVFIAHGELTSIDIFTRLGGDSLSLMRLAFSLRAKGFLVDVTKIHLGLTLKQMAQLLTGIGQEHKASETLTVEPFSLLGNVSVASLRENIRRRLHVPLEAIHDIYPMSPMQMALIASSAKSPGSYTNKITFTLPQSVDLDRLEGAVRRTVGHQEILRTAFFENVEGLTVQVVLNTTPKMERPASTKFIDEKDYDQDFHLPAVFYLEKTNISVLLHVIIHHAAIDAS